MLHKRLHSHAVHPVAESFLLSCFFKVGQLFFNWLKCRIVIEQVADESQIQLRVTINNILGSHKLAAFHLGGIVEDEPGKFHRVGHANVWFADPEFRRGDLVGEKGNLTK